MNFDVVVVLGMHRSGTSLLNSALRLLGVHLGENLMPPQPDNPKGFFEDLDVVRINERILQKSSSHWASLQSLDPARLRGPQFAEELAEARKWLTRKTVAGAPLGLKDPRLCRTLPLWQMAFQADDLRVGYVLTYRNPRDVAASLKKRNRFPEAYGKVLWASYQADALRHLGGQPWIVVGFDGLLRQPGRDLARLGRFLGAPTDLALSASHGFAKELVDPALIRQTKARKVSLQPAALQTLDQCLLAGCLEDSQTMQKKILKAAAAVFDLFAGALARADDSEGFLRGEIFWSGKSGWPPWKERNTPGFWRRLEQKIRRMRKGLQSWVTPSKPKS